MQVSRPPGCRPQHAEREDKGNKLSNAAVNVRENGRSKVTLREMVDRKYERARLLHWPLRDESKIFRRETNSRTWERRSNRQTNKQANDK